jgi:uncharacterized protein YdaL
MWSKKLLHIFCFLAMICCDFGQQAWAAPADQTSTVLVLYQDDSMKNDAQVVANLAGHFSLKSDQVHYQDHLKINLAKYDFIFYLTGDHTNPQELKESVKTAGKRIPIFWIGSLGQATPIDSIIQVDYKNKSYPIKDQFVYKIDQAAHDQTYATATNGLDNFPLILRHQDEWYYLSNQLWGVMGNIFADVLHEFFNQPHQASHEAFIRIEDVHPAIDPKKLRAIADYLYAKGIPFMVAVIPVYYNPNNDTYLTLDQSPEFREALRYMVRKGGSIILHGYSHQYLKRETGEGFEFWDIQRDKPIQNEDQYMRDKLEKGIAMLLRNGLTPVAFEPPHYAMSQNGYQILSHYFSTLVGQLQISDETYQTAQKPPYRLNRDVNGLKIIPETIGYVTNDDYYMSQIESNMRETLLVRDSVVGVFYHPYISIDKLKHLVDWLETYPLDFINLQKEENWVHTDFAEIQAGWLGVKVNVTNPQKFASFAIQDKRQSFLSKYFADILWGVVSIVSLFSLLFMLNLYYLKRKLPARLFDEKDFSG